jgi:hypothetical protein
MAAMAIIVLIGCFKKYSFQKPLGKLDYDIIALN